MCSYCCCGSTNSTGHVRQRTASATSSIVTTKFQWWSNLLSIFCVKLILEVFGSAGAIWGFSEACGFRTTYNSIWLWRPIALSVGIIFAIRWILQIIDHCCCYYQCNKTITNLMQMDQQPNPLQGKNEEEREALMMEVGLSGSPSSSSSLSSPPSYHYPSYHNTDSPLLVVTPTKKKPCITSQSSSIITASTTTTSTTCITGTPPETKTTQDNMDEDTHLL